MREPEEGAAMLALHAKGWGGAADRSRAWREPQHGQALPRCGVALYLGRVVARSSRAEARTRLRDSSA
jgi:hypothetical protein